MCEFHGIFLSQPEVNSSIFTARKRSLRWLCFYTCLSVILLTGVGGGCLPKCMLGCTSPGTRGHMLTPPRGVGTLLWETLDPALGTYSTGMLSCFLKLFSCLEVLIDNHWQTQGEGVPGMRAPRGPNSFIFMQFSIENLQNNTLAHPLWQVAPPPENSRSITDNINDSLTL